MKRTLFRLALVLVLTVGIGLGAGFHLLNAPNRAAVATDDRVATSDGRVTLVRPAGWVERACPSARVVCLEISPPGAGGGDHVTVLVGKSDADGEDAIDYYLGHEPPGGFDHPSIRRLSIDGAEALRVDPGWSPGPEQHGPAAPARVIMVVGRILDSREPFMVECEYDRLKAEIRGGCDLIVESLRITS